MTERRAGVMGWPVAHSKSPLLHGYWLKHYGVTGTYVRIPVKPEDLEKELRALPERGFAGVNLTVPHKEAALAIVDELTDEARRIGAANTIFVDGSRLRATNTDAYGFIANLRASAPSFESAAGPAVVIGAGGAARAVCFALKHAGVPEIRIVNRTAARAETLACDFDLTVLAWDDRAHALDGANLLVNCTTMGMQGQPPLPLALDRLPPTAVINDIVYAPLETPLLAAGRARGNPVVDGLGMLLYQAQPGFEGWFGIRPDVTPALRDYVLSTPA